MFQTTGAISTLIIDSIQNNKEFAENIQLISHCVPCFRDSACDMTFTSITTTSLLLVFDQPIMLLVNHTHLIWSGKSSYNGSQN